MTRHVLTIACRNRIGIVAAVSTVLAENGCNIVDAQQFDDTITGRFFMRIEFDQDGDPGAVDAALAPLAERMEMTLTRRRARQMRRVLILVSRFDHCLVDLVYRTRIGELNMEIVAIASNHARDEIGFTEAPGIPFHHLPVTPATKPAQEAQIRALVESSGAELVILARYMQILSDDLSAWLSGRCINIHHAFLPGFKGAKPYHQAHERGVKMIGATAHYVTGDLDEGPIISQDVERISRP